MFLATDEDFITEWCTFPPSSVTMSHRRANKLHSLFSNGRCPQMYLMGHCSRGCSTLNLQCLLTGCNSVLDLRMKWFLYVNWDCHCTRYVVGDARRDGGTTLLVLFPVHEMLPAFVMKCYFLAEHSSSKLPVIKFTLFESTSSMGCGSHLRSHVI